MIHAHPEGSWRHPCTRGMCLFSRQIWSSYFSGHDKVLPEQWRCDAGAAYPPKSLSGQVLWLQKRNTGAWEADGGKLPSTACALWMQRAGIRPVFWRAHFNRRRCLSSWLAESCRHLQRPGGTGVYRIIPKHLQTFVSLVRSSKWHDSAVTYTPISHQALLVLAIGCWLGLWLAPPGTTRPPQHRVSSPLLCPKATLLRGGFPALPPAAPPLAFSDRSAYLPFPGCALFAVILPCLFFPASFQN